MAFNPMSLLNLFPFLPPIFNMAYSGMMYVIGIYLVYVIIKKIKNLGAVRTFILWKDGTHNIKNFIVKNDELQIQPRKKFRKRKTWTPKVNYDSIIPARKKFRDYTKILGLKQKDIVIAVEDSLECITLRGIHTVEDIQEAVQSKILKTWTLEEIDQYIRKCLSYGSVERRLFKDTHFYIFMFILIIIVFFQMRLMMGLNLL